MISFEQLKKATVPQKERVMKPGRVTRLVIGIPEDVSDLYDEIKYDAEAEVYHGEVEGSVVIAYRFAKKEDK